MEEQYRAYFAFLEQLGGELEQLTELARRKNQAAARADLLQVDECMKREQALSMSLRGMDKKRETLLGELGLTGAPLSALPERCPESLRMEAKAAAEKLRRRYRIYQSAAEAARTTLECNLHQIEKHLDEEAAGQTGAAHPFTDIRA